MKRMRQAGQIPAVLYGHGKENVKLSVDAKQLNKAIHLGNRVVTLSGSTNQEVLIKDVQWDAFGIDVMHVDFTRLNVDEVVEISVSLELKGESPGAKQGGEVNVLVQEIKITCPANVIPEKLPVNIDDLQIDQYIKVGDLKLPEGAMFVTAEDIPVVNCVGKADADSEDSDE